MEFYLDLWKPGPHSLQGRPGRLDEKVQFLLRRCERRTNALLFGFVKRIPTLLGAPKRRCCEGPKEDEDGEVGAVPEGQSQKVWSLRSFLPQSLGQSRICNYGTQVFSCVPKVCASPRLSLRNTFETPHVSIFTPFRRPCCNLHAQRLTEVQVPPGRRHPQPPGARRRSGPSAAGSAAMARPTPGASWEAFWGFWRASGRAAGFLLKANEHMIPMLWVQGPRR